MEQTIQLAHLARVAVIGQLSRALTHELAQPLTAILSNAQAAQRFIAQDGANRPEVRESLEDIANDAVWAGDLVHRLRALLSQRRMRARELDVVKLVEEVLSLAQRDLAACSLTIESRFEAGPAVIRADGARMQQMLLHLLLSLADAVPLGRAKARRLSVSVKRDAHAVGISIEQQGGASVQVTLPVRDLRRTPAPS